MSCLTCKNNTYTAAKRRHLKCLAAAEKVGWHSRTLCGAIMSGDRRVYDKVKAMDNGRARAWDVINAAAKEGWRDVVADHYEGPYDVNELDQLMSSAMSGHHLDMCEFVYLNYYKDVVRFNDKTYRWLLLYAAKSASLSVVLWFVEQFEWRPHYIDEFWERHIFTAAVKADDVEVLGYLWPRFDRHTHQQCMRYWYLEEALPRSPNAFKFLVDKCTTELGYRIEAGFKDYVLTHPRHAYQNIMTLYRNNNEWGFRFKHSLDEALNTAGPRYKRNLERVKAFAKERGMYGALLLEKIRDLIGDVEQAREPVDIHVLMNYIDNTDMPEGRYVEVCKLMRRLFNAL